MAHKMVGLTPLPAAALVLALSVGGCVAGDLHATPRPDPTDAGARGQGPGAMPASTSRAPFGFQPVSAGPSGAGAAPSDPWVPAAPDTLLPGDSFDLTVFTAPELNRTLRVGADGRTPFPLVGSVVTAGATPSSLATELTRLYDTELRDPIIEIVPQAQTSRQVFVGGEVARPGLLDMPGPIDPLQATILGGGATPAGDLSRVIVIRRGADGRPAMRVLDLRAGLRDVAALPDLALQRHDVVWVPRRRVSEVGLWVQQNIRDLIPVPFSVSYNLGNLAL